MTKYIKEKIKLLRELGISPTIQQIACLKAARNEIHCDNIARSIILGEPVYIRKWGNYGS